MARMSEKDFQERNPERGGGNGFTPTAPSSTGLGLWEECRRARDSEVRLIEALNEFVRLVEEFGKGWDEADWPVAIDHLKKQAEEGRAALKGAESNG